MQNNFYKTEENPIELSDIQHKEIETKEFLVNNKLIVNSEKGNLLNELKRALSECDRFYFSVAFVNFSGVQLLLDSFKEAEDRGIKGKILTSTYLNFTEPKALSKIREFTNIDLKVFVATDEKGFHTKAYIFENQLEFKIIIGSSNITQRALKSNAEWNVMTISKKDDSFVHEVTEEYIKLWSSDFTSEATQEFLDSYSKFIKELKRSQKSNKIEFKDYEIIKPNSMQERAIDNLDRLRNSGEEKAIVVAATGTGKTYMSAFDVMNYKPHKLLFLVHREDILKSAEKTFRKLAKNKNKTTGFLTGNSKDMDADYLFATVQSMNINLESFKKDEFEYIIVDEAHHAASPTYKRIMEYFKP